jgi:hypothetical protein
MPGTRCLYLSHTAGKRSDPDWWIVEPRDDVERLAAQVWSLLDCGRRVLQVSLWDLGGQVHELTDLPREIQEGAVREMEYRAENGYRPAE